MDTIINIIPIIRHLHHQLARVRARPFVSVLNIGLSEKRRHCQKGWERTVPPKLYAGSGRRKALRTERDEPDVELMLLMLLACIVYT